MSTCTLCHGRTQADHTRIEYWRDGQLCVVEKIPASVCENCGEATISSATQRRIEALLDDPPTPREIFQVPVFDLGDPAPDKRAEESDLAAPAL